MPRTTSAFIAKYQARFGSLPDAAAALTWDSAQLLFKAIATAGKADPKAIRDALAATKGFQGVTGAITYTGTGDPVKGAVVIKIDIGEISAAKSGMRSPRSSSLRRMLRARTAAYCR